MAKTKKTPLNFILTLTFSLLIHSNLSRTITTQHSHSYSHTTTTTFLDVSACIQQTLQLLSSQPTQHHQDHQQLLYQTTLPTTSTSTFSLSLHPRSTLSKPLHNDYKSLTLSRLARDSARVSSLTAKLHLSLNPINHSALFQPEDLQSPVSSGTSQGSGEYFAQVGLGEPAKSFSMTIDTGSDVSWIQCQPCSDCYQQSDPIFNPSESSTYKSLPCGSQQCNSLDLKTCRAETCLYQVSYGDGSYTVGDLATETVSFGNSGSVANVAIGCGHDNEGLFVGSAGIIGLGGGLFSFPSQIKATSFSYCLVGRDSTSSSTLDFNSARPVDSVLAPLLRNSRLSTFLYVGLTGLSVGGQLLSIPAGVFAFDGNGKGGVIVDSGTAITRLQTQAYNTFRDSFVRMSKNLPSSGGLALFDTCYDLSSMSKVSVPTVSFHFGDGKTLPSHPNNYLIPVDSAGKFCLAFAPTEDSLSIIGNVQQQGTRVSYDLSNNLVGFSPNKC